MTNKLQDFLATIPPGAISDTTDLEHLLAACWDEFTGDDGGMMPRKLLGRMEGVVWAPPILSFAIERHGGTVMGSTRAELQYWQVNLEQKTATLTRTGHRQLRQMAKRMRIKPLVEKILAAIRSGKDNGNDNELVSSHNDGTVSLNTTLIFPEGSAVRMTLDGRRKRLREAVAKALVDEGWERLGKDVFRPGEHGTQH